MRKNLVAVALCCLFAVGVTAESWAAEPTTTTKKKQKRKGKKSAVAPAAAGAASTTPTQSESAAPTVTNEATPVQAVPAAAKESEAGQVVKTELYTVVDGFKVDKATMEGFRTWRSAACDRCHGPNQEGLVGPSLIERLKTLSKDDFKKVVLEGRLEKGMPSFNTNERVVKYIDNLYAYLKGRSDGVITKAKTMEMD